MQFRVKTLAQGFNTAAQDSNPGSRSRESEALPLSHCALIYGYAQPLPTHLASSSLEMHMSYIKLHESILRMAVIPNLDIASRPQ